MRWFSFAIVVLVALLLQVAVCRVFGMGPQDIIPDLLLLVGVVLAFRGRPNEALLGCWILGLIKDLSSEAVLGSYALSFGVMALLILRLRDVFYGYHTVALMLLTLLGGFLIEQAVFTLGLLRGYGTDNYRQLTLEMLLSALLTAALAPYGQWLLMKMHRQLGLQRHRTYRR